MHKIKKLCRNCKKFNTCLETNKNMYCKDDFDPLEEAIRQDEFNIIKSYLIHKVQHIEDHSYSAVDAVSKIKDLINYLEEEDYES